MRILSIIVLSVALTFLVLGCADQSAEAPGSSEKAKDPDPALGEDAERTSDEPATPQPPKATVRDYEITDKQETTKASYAVVVYSVSTDATSEEDFRAITVELRAENPEKQAVLINFYPNEPDADLSGTGEAFVDSRAASAILGSAYTREDVEEIMDDDGLLVVSVQDAGQETTGIGETKG